MKNLESLQNILLKIEEIKKSVILNHSPENIDEDLFVAATEEKIAIIHAERNQLIACEKTWVETMSSLEGHANTLETEEAENWEQKVKLIQTSFYTQKVHLLKDMDDSEQLLIEQQKKQKVIETKLSSFITELSTKTQEFEKSITPPTSLPTAHEDEEPDKSAQINVENAFAYKKRVSLYSQQYKQIEEIAKYSAKFSSDPLIKPLLEKNTHYSQEISILHERILQFQQTAKNKISTYQKNWHSQRIDHYQESVHKIQKLAKKFQTKKYTDSPESKESWKTFEQKLISTLQQLREDQKSLQKESTHDPAKAKEKPLKTFIHSLEALKTKTQRKHLELLEDSERDFQTNKNIKLNICTQLEKTLQLAESEGKVAWKQWFQATEKWKRTGMVPRDIKEELYTNFEKLKTAVHEKFTSFFKEFEKKSLHVQEKRKDLISQLETLTEQLNETHSIKNFDTQLKTLLKNWKELKTNTEVHSSLHRDFKKALENLFAQRKILVDKVLQEKGAENLEKKRNLIKQIETLTTSNQAWPQIKEKALHLMKNWRLTHPAPNAESNALYEQFRSHCDKLFAKHQESFQDNLNKKKNLLKKLQELTQQSAPQKSKETPSTSAAPHTQKQKLGEEEVAATMTVAKPPAQDPSNLPTHEPPLTDSADPEELKTAQSSTPAPSEPQEQEQKLGLGEEEVAATMAAAKPPAQDPSNLPTHEPPLTDSADPEELKTAQSSTPAPSEPQEQEQKLGLGEEEVAATMTVAKPPAQDPPNLPTHEPPPTDSADPEKLKTAQGSTPAPSEPQEQEKLGEEEVAAIMAAAKPPAQDPSNLPTHEPPLTDSADPEELKTAQSSTPAPSEPQEQEQNLGLGEEEVAATMAAAKPPAQDLSNLPTHEPPSADLEKIKATIKKVRQIEIEWKNIGPIGRENKDIEKTFQKLTRSFFHAEKDNVTLLRNLQKDAHNQKNKLLETLEDIIYLQDGQKDVFKKIDAQIRGVQKKWRELGPTYGKGKALLEVPYRALLDRFYNQKHKRKKEATMNAEKIIEQKISLITRLAVLTNAEEIVSEKHDVNIRDLAVQKIKIVMELNQKYRDPLKKENRLKEIQDVKEQWYNLPALGYHLEDKKLYKLFKELKKIPLT